MKQCILCGAEGDTYFCEKCGGRMENPSASEKSIDKNIHEMEKVNYLNIVFIFLAIIVVVKLVSVGEFLWQFATLAVVVKTVDVYMSHKGKVLLGQKMEEWKKRLICLSVSFLLLFALDSYYHESGNPYDKTDIHGHIVTKFESNDEQNKIWIIVSEVENSEFGKYFKISSYVGKTRAVGNFRVFKEKGVVYEDPVIVNEEDNCRIIIKRKNMDDLVFIIPYYNIKS